MTHTVDVEETTFGRIDLVLCPVTKTSMASSLTNDTVLCMSRQGCEKANTSENCHLYLVVSYRVKKIVGAGEWVRTSSQLLEPPREMWGHSQQTRMYPRSSWSIHIQKCTRRVLGQRPHQKTYSWSVHKDRKQVGGGRSHLSNICACRILLKLALVVEQVSPVSI